MSSLVSNLRNSWEKNWPELHATCTGGLPRFIFARRPRDLGPSVPVFCYHSVIAEEVEADLEFLSRNGYTTIDADGLLDHLEQRCEAPKRAVMLTIDDGSRNLYEVIFPLLQRYGMKAVAFIATQFHREDGRDLSADAQGNCRRPISWSQISEMHASGVIDFQSHTHEHRYLPRWPEPADLEGCDPEFVHPLRGPVLTVAEDFQLAKKILEQRLHKTVYHLAFPRFKGTAEALCIGRQCGYKAFWWGVLPRRPGNEPGQSPLYIVRLKCDFLRRLPGEGREPLTRILQRHYRGSASRFWGYVRTDR